MTELINLQHQMLLVSLILGAWMGFTYDLLRCFRRIIPQSLLFVSIEDFIYWFIWTMVIINSIVRFNYGEIRIYIFVFLFVGFMMYKTTIGWVLMKIFNYMWCRIKNCLHNAKKTLKKTRNNSKI
ncbi:MAG: hypothetical protein E7257_05040 [Lachnospiraceae bacterium]|nr:hypothetical protein [Lachnospiraceae bacterium]MBQ9936407.1 spore cortex biosynthesis protein YabQ [Lachnospiraceae bacterium]